MRLSSKEKEDKLVATRKERLEVDKEFRNFVEEGEQKKELAKIHRNFLKRNFLDQIQDQKERQIQA